MTPGPVTPTQKLVALLSIPEAKYASGGAATEEEGKEGNEAVKTLAKGDVSINLHKALFTACVFVFYCSGVFLLTGLKHGPLAVIIYGA